HRDGLTAVVDEQLLAGAMHLAHRHVDPLAPLPVQLTEAAVAIAQRLALPVLLPEQLQRHALALELLVHLRPIHRRPLRQRRRLGRWVEPLLELRIAQRRRSLPAHAAVPRTSRTFGHIRLADPDTGRSLPV